MSEKQKMIISITESEYNALLQLRMTQEEPCEMPLIPDDDRETVDGFLNRLAHSMRFVDWEDAYLNL